MTPLNAEYWGCLLTLADHELEAQRCEPAATCCCQETPTQVSTQASMWGGVRGCGSGFGVVGAAKGWHGVNFVGPHCTHPLGGMYAVSALQGLLGV